MCTSTAAAAAAASCLIRQLDRFTLALQGEEGEENSLRKKEGRKNDKGPRNGDDSPKEDIRMYVRIVEDIGHTRSSSSSYKYVAREIELN